MFKHRIWFSLMLIKTEVAWVLGVALDLSAGHDLRVVRLNPILGSAVGSAETS